MASITRRRARIFQFGQCICGRKATARDWRAEGGRSCRITFSYETGFVIEIAPQMGAHARFAFVCCALDFGSWPAPSGSSQCTTVPRGVASVDHQRSALIAGPNS